MPRESVPQEPVTEPVKDSVRRDADVAVGEDLGFQRKWWVFERVVWSLFLLILVADVLGAFGRGWLAKAQAVDSGQGLTVDYERVERASTPSILALRVGPQAVHNGELHIFVSESVVRKLGAQRISPQPLRSTLTEGGVEYTFPATGTPATIEFQLQPSFIGVQRFSVAVEGADGKQSDAKPISRRVLVVP